MLTLVDGEEDVKARFVSKGYQGPDLKDGLVETSGSVSLRSSHLRVRYLGDLTKSDNCCPDIMSASLHTDGFRREVFLCAPVEWRPEGARRIWKLYAPAYGLGDAPVAFRMNLWRLLS